MTTKIPASLLETMISSGDYDADLDIISQAVNERLMKNRASRKNADFGIGDRVKFNDFCGTKYLRGHTAKVVGKKKTKVVVRLEAPTGRFVRIGPNGPESVDVTVPPSIIDLVV